MPEASHIKATIFLEAVAAPIGLQVCYHTNDYGVWIIKGSCKELVCACADHHEWEEIGLRIKHDQRRISLLRILIIV